MQLCSALHFRTVLCVTCLKVDFYSMNVVEAKLFYVLLWLTWVSLECLLMPSDFFTGNRCLSFPVSYNWKPQFYGHCHHVVRTSWTFAISVVWPLQVGQHQNMLMFICSSASVRVSRVFWEVEDIRRPWVCLNPFEFKHFVFSILDF